MSNDKNDKHVGDDVFALALFLGGGFLAFSTILSLFGDGMANNPTTQFVLNLHGALGAVPTLLACLAAAVLGVAGFMRKTSLPLLQPLGMILALFAASSLVLGAFGAGGSLGGFLPGALGGVAGGIVGVLLGLVVLAGAAWLALGMPSLKRGPVGGTGGISEKEGEFGSIAAALKEDTGDGVTAAEAAALIPDGPPSVEAAPGVREFEMRMRGELPAGVKPIGESDDDGESEAQGDVQVEASALGAAAAAGSAGSVGADLAAAEEADGAARVEGHWVRESADDEAVALEDEPAEFDDEPVEFDDESDDATEAADDSDVAAYHGRGPVVPSWESAELDEEDEAELEDDGFAAVELEVPLEVDAAVEEEDFDEDADELEDDEDELDEDAAAELDEEDDDSDEETDELEDDEDELDEDAAAELDEDDEDSDEETDELEGDEDVAAALDEDASDEDGDDLDEGAAAELAAEFDEDDLADALEEDVEAAPHFQGVAQPGLFDADEEEPMLASVEPDAEDMTPATAEPEALAEVELEPVARKVVESEDAGTSAVDESVTASKEAVVEQPTVGSDEDAADEDAADEGAADESAAEESAPAATAAPAAADEPAPVRPGTEDELIFRAGALFLSEGRVAVSMLQRRFDLSFKEATRVLDDLQEIGLIGPYIDGKRRDFLMSAEEWEELNLTS